MSFDEILNRAIELLRRERRLSYRGLKHRLDIDDAMLQAIKAEIVEAKRLGTDENGIVLVWAEAAQQTSNAAPVVRATVGERRQLTVMFCDLVGSTELSQRTDPEELAKIIRGYHELCAAAVSQFDGFLAQYLGDGVLAYFSYPVAHEDDAARAVRAGLEIIRRLARRDHSPHQLRARVGIHTGLVVVDEMAVGAGRDLTAIVGEAPNLAARIQQAAEPNTVVISAATYRLVRGHFVCQSLGPRRFKGIAEPVEVHQVRSESEAESRFEAATSTGLTTFVDRREELGLLLQRWRLATRGHGQVVAISGDAGIGKSRLLHEFKQHLIDDAGTRIEYNCSPYHESSALHPVVDRLNRLLRFSASDTPEEKLAKLNAAMNTRSLRAPDAMPLLASLLSLPSQADEHAELTPQQRKEKTFAALLSWLREESERAPLCVIFEDLQWADPSTLEYLSRLFVEIPTMHALLLLTFRHGFVPVPLANAPISQLTLSRMDSDDARQIVESITGDKALPRDVMETILDKTDGVPLFVEELTRAVVESGSAGTLGKIEQGIRPALPATIHDSLTARLDSLGEYKEVAQIGAMLGREFSHELIEAVSLSDPATLVQGLDKLLEMQLVNRIGSALQTRYLFKHALIQDAAYESILKSKRQQYHRHIAEVIERRFGEIARSQPELLAHHYTEADLALEAIRYRQLAAEKAVQRSANTEAIAHLRKALGLLERLPETPERIQQELMLQTALGVPLMVTEGFGSPEAERVYERARELCRQVGETPQLFPVLWGLWVPYTARGKHETALEVSQQCLNIAQRANEPVLLMEARHLLGVSLLELGDFRRALDQLDQAIATYDPDKHRALAYTFGQDSCVVCLSHSAWALWFLGYPDQARRRNQKALASAERIAHPFSLALACDFAAWLHQICREHEMIRGRTETAIRLSSDHQFAFLMHMGEILRGWAIAAECDIENGISQIGAGLRAFEATGTETMKPYFLALLAEVYARTGKSDEGLEVLGTAQVIANRNKERWWQAELYRLTGELTLARAKKRGDERESWNESERCFRLALQIARRQEAKSLELRAAMSLGRLLDKRRVGRKARALLEPIYGWFTEGFDTPDLKEAKAILATLS
ncbi:MAG: ATP-binding protein [Candidatus Binataceae bacterium]